MTRRIGGHLSCAGGYQNAISKAMEIGANSVQIFSGSPRVWARKPLNDSELEALVKLADKQDVRPIFVHALYLINLASENKESVQKSKDVLIHELKFSDKIKSGGVVVHLGSHQGRGWDAVKDDLAKSIKEIIVSAKSSAPFLIENSAGQKGKLCSDLAEIKWLIDAVNEPTLGWCYDTCHGWAAGYSALTNADKNLFTTIDEHHLWKNLHCIHANDSRDPFASGRDRHANIGQGTIPHEEWKALLSESRWQNVPLITEAPGLDGEGPDKFNIDALKKLTA